MPRQHEVQLVHLILPAVQVGQYDGAGNAGAHQVALPPNGAFESCKRILEPVHRKQQETAIVVGLGEIGSQFRHALIALQRLGAASQLRQHHAVPEVAERHVGLDAERAGDQFLRFGGIAAFRPDYAEQQKRAGMPGLGRDDLAADRFGFREPPRLLQFNRPVEWVWVGHRARPRGGLSMNCAEPSIPGGVTTGER